MFSQFKLAVKNFLIVIASSYFITSHGYPSHFFYYPEVQSIENQSYLLIKYDLKTDLLYPELNIIRLPGASIRYMRSKNTLPDIAIRLIIRSKDSFKYAKLNRNIFSLAMALQIAINQSWASVWTTNNPIRKVIASSSGPCFETRATSISGLSTHLQPLLEGLKTVTVSSAEVTSSRSSIRSSYSAIFPINSGATKIYNYEVLPVTSQLSTNEIGNSGDLILVKGLFNITNIAVFTPPTANKRITSPDIIDAMESLKNSPMEFFIVSSQELIPENIVTNIKPIIQTHSPNLSHAIMYNFESPGMATNFMNISQRSITPRGSVLFYPTGDCSISSLIALEILEQHLFSISTPIAAGDYKVKWAPIAQVGWIVVSTGPLCSVTADLAGKDIDEYTDEVIVANFQNTVTLSYIKDRLLSSWSDCLGSAQKRNKSLDAVIAINNNNVIDGFFTWMEEWYNKERTIDDLLSIGKTITANSEAFNDICTEIDNIFSSLRSFKLKYRHSENDVFTHLKTRPA